MQINLDDLVWPGRNQPILASGGMVGDQPRWFWWKGLDTRHELASTEIVDGIRKRGHDARVWNQRDAYGRGQIIWRLPSGVYIAGSDVRGDGQAVGY